MASHFPIQPSGMPAPLPVQALPARVSASAAPAPAGGPAPAVVELRPTPDSAPAAAPAVAAPAPAAPVPAPIGIAAVDPAVPPTEAPPATAVTFRVFVRLSNGERIQVGTHGDETAAKAEATALMRFLKADGGDWPFLDGRFVRPEAMVSVDVVAG